MWRRLFKVIQKGECVKNPALWKMVQVKVGVLLVLIPILTIISPPAAIALKVWVTAIQATCAAIVTYLTFATSEKIGV